MSRKRGIVCGVGINDADYSVMVHAEVDGKDKVVWICPFYNTWKGMLARCYSEKFLRKMPVYVGCSVCEEWLTFSKFRNWMVSQNWQDNDGKTKQLDKDLLSDCLRGKCYAPNTCIFVSHSVNSFISNCSGTNGDLPRGVRYYPKNGKFNAQIQSPKVGKKVNLGYYDTPEEASVVYIKAKSEIAAWLAEKEDDPVVKQILLTKSWG